ncbi:MAG: dTDP-4-dehydrorhamnose reductase [Acidobacteriia bacterium 12-62-4]|nr:MAG: dTDP-4-dehydrorhamnose reductase [Acidobacteriia bacterium 12-62-4]
MDPAIVLNAAAYNMVDVAEREPQVAYQANALGVRNLAIACRQVDATLVHFSTDYVFDGTLGRPYVETDLPCPLGAYAVSKLAGEYFARAYHEQSLVLRTSGVFGPGGRHTARGNFVETMLRLAQSGKPIQVVQEYLASPTYSPALAETTANLVDAGHIGLFHAGGGVAISWYDFAAKIFAAAGLSPTLTVARPETYRTEARRPRFSALANARIEALGLPPMPSLDAALTEYMERR